MNYENGERRTSGVAWTALILSLVAIVFAWSAFNRAGADIEDMVRQQVDEATQEMQEDYQQLEANVRANVSDDLQDASNDAAVDSDPGSAGE